jgi:hypothetical protein
VQVIGSVAFEHEDAGAKHDRHVRHIEDPRAQRANADVHEVDHHSVARSQPIVATIARSKTSRAPILLIIALRVLRQ